MTERAWIKIHSGLNDPTHRTRMGIRIWLFMWLVEHADWESGVVYNYTDKIAGSEMQMPSRTVEDQRQTLEGDNYIKCHPGFQCQHIRVMRWRNPRLVNPPQINIPGDETSYGTLRTHPTELSVPIPPVSSVPLLLDSHISQTSTQESDGSRPSIYSFYEKNIGMLTPVTAEFLDYWSALVQESWIEDAIKIAVNSNARKNSYIQAILQRWQNEGKDDGLGNKNGNGHKQPVEDTWA